MMLTAELGSEVTVSHLGRDAYVYVRQSTLTQVREHSLFPNPVVAESILDRVVNTAHHVAMVGKSYRPNKRPGAAPTDKP